MGGKEQLFQSGVSVWASGQRVGQGVCGEPCTRPQLQASTVGGGRWDDGHTHTAGATFWRGKSNGRQRLNGERATCTATGPGGKVGLPWLALPWHADYKALLAASCQLPAIFSSGLPTRHFSLASAHLPKPEAPLDRHNPPSPPQLAARRETLVSCRSISPEPRLSCA